MNSSAIRKIIHCDCDCFYAAIEMRDDPSLRDKPLAVGGRPENRGVVATCNYEARQFGIRSAMGMAQALKLCPGLIIIPPSMEKYREASKQINAIYRDYTDLVEPLSLDEAYLDVTDSNSFNGSATLIASDIRKRIANTVGITASAGAAPNKFLAKIASDWNKPDGLFVIRPHEVENFVDALPVDKLFGVGPVTTAKLHKLGIKTCEDLKNWPIANFQRYFGKFGSHLYNLCRGIDHRAVNPMRERKSISVEETYSQDLPDLAACVTQLAGLLEQLNKRVQKANAQKEVQKVFVKLRFSDFSKTTIERVETKICLATYHQLIEEAYLRLKKSVRLIGVGVRLKRIDDAQANLFCE